MNIIVDEDDDQGLKKLPNPNADIEERINKSKEKLKWRQPFDHSRGIVSEMYRMLSPQRLSVAHSDFLTYRIDWSVEGIKKEAANRRAQLEIIEQVFIPERHRILGNNLAAAHFLIFRGGLVRYVNDNTTSLVFIK